MPVEVGSAVLEIIPSARGFKRRLEQEMTGDAQAAGANAGDAAGQGFSQHFFRDVNGRLHDLRGRFVSEGALAGQGFTEHFNDTVRGNSGSFTKAGQLAAVNFSDGLLGFLRSPVGIIAIVAVMPLLGATLAAAILSGVGLGMLGLGAVLLRGNPAIQATFGNIRAQVANAFKGVADPLVQPMVDGLKTIGAAVASTGPAFRDMFTALAPTIKPLAEGLAGFIKNVMPGLTSAVKASVPVLTQIGTMLPGLGTSVSDFLSSIAKAGPGAVTFFRELIPLIGQILGFVGRFIQVTSAIFAWLEQFRAGLATFRSNVEGFFTALPGRIGAALAALPRILADAAQAAFHAFFFAVGFGAGLIYRLFTEMPGRIAGFVSDAWARARQLFSEGVSAVVSTVRGLPGQVGGAVSGLWSAIRGAIGDLFSRGLSIGADLIHGMVSGVTGAVQALIDAAVSAVRSAIAGARRALGISSPSRVFAGLGEQTVAGFVRGMEDNASAIGRAAARLFGGAAGPAAGYGPAPIGGQTFNQTFHTAAQSPTEVAAAVRRELAWTAAA